MTLRGSFQYKLFYNSCIYVLLYLWFMYSCSEAGGNGLWSDTKRVIWRHQYLDVSQFPRLPILLGIRGKTGKLTSKAIYSPPRVRLCRCCSLALLMHPVPKGICYEKQHNMCNTGVISKTAQYQLKEVSL